MSSDVNDDLAANVLPDPDQECTQQQSDEQVKSRTGFLENTLLSLSACGDSNRLSRSNALAIVALLTVLVTIVTTTSLGVVTIAKQSRSWNVQAILNVSTARFCDFDECINSKCNVGVAPYVCVLHDGPNFGGW
jgi:hypothetical protein